MNEDKEFTTEGLYNSILCEIRDELSIASDKIEPINNNSAVLISAYRELVEGGKPQLLFYAKSKMTKDEIEKNFFEIKILNSKSFKNKKGKKPLHYEEYKFKSPQEQKMLYDGNKSYYVKGSFYCLIHY